MATLMQRILGYGHCLGLDNYYTDVILIEWLVANNIDVVGTIRANRRHFPENVMSKDTKAGRGAIEVSCSLNMWAMRWMDNKEVRVVSTFSSPMNNGARGKPDVIQDYNRIMPGIDTSDQMRHARMV